MSGHPRNIDTKLVNTQHLESNTLIYGIMYSVCCVVVDAYHIYIYYYVFNISPQKPD
jgi:hypothetical protein